MQTVVLKNEDLDPTVMGEILEFRSQIFEEVYQLASEKPDSYSPEKPDDYDRQSVHFILRDEDGIIRAYARMIFGQITELPIYHDCCSPLPNLQTPAVEISLLCVCPSCRGGFTGYDPLYVLIIEMMKYSSARGITNWYCSLLSKFYYAARKLLNLPLQRLEDKKRLSENNYFYPCLLDIVETVARNQIAVYSQYMLAKLTDPSRFDRRRLQAFGRLVAQKLAA